MNDVFSEDKLDAVRKFLGSEFPEYEVADAYDFHRVSQTFRLSKGLRIFLITVSHPVLDGHSPTEIGQILDRINLSQILENENVKRIVVRNDGIFLEDK